MKTAVYVDGLNLYYGALRDTPFRWLDLPRLCRLLLPRDEILQPEVTMAVANRKHVAHGLGLARARRPHKQHAARRSPRVVRMNIEIMRAFVRLRRNGTARAESIRKMGGSPVESGVHRAFTTRLLTPADHEGILRSQSVTSSSWGGRRYCPFAFTEQGVAMHSSVLRSPRAVRVNIEIMRAFVRLRRMLESNAELAHKLDALEQRYDAQFKVVFQAIRELMRSEHEPKRIGFGT